MSEPGPLPVGGILDDPDAMAASDPGGMLGRVAAFPDQVADAWARTRNLAMPGARPSAVAVLGLGGSAIGGDLVHSVWSDRISVPVEVVRGHELPAWVGRETLVIASSASGATEETISALGAALERRCPVAVLTTGGPMKDVALRVGLPIATFPPSGTSRSSLGYAFGLLAGMLERSGLLSLDATEIDAGVAAAREMASRCAPSVATELNPAKQLAWSLVDRYPIIEAGGFLVPVARRWKAQLNENAKATAAVEELPEATHSTVMGYEQPDSLRDRLFVVHLGSDLDHPRAVQRAGLAREILDVGHITYEVVEPIGGSRLAHALSMVVMGDHVSVYLAFTYAVDPSSMIAADHIRDRSAMADAATAE